MSTVEQLIERLGGVAATARAFDVAHTSILKWRKRGEIPLERTAHAAELLGVHPADLRPDLATMFTRPPLPGPTMPVPRDISPAHPAEAA